MYYSPMKLVLAVALMAGVTWAEDIGSAKCVPISSPDGTSYMCAYEPHLNSDDLLPYYKAQRDLDNLMHQASIVDAQARVQAAIQKLRDKCGDRSVIGDGAKLEYDCGPKAAEKK